MAAVIMHIGSIYRCRMCNWSIKSSIHKHEKLKISAADIISLFFLREVGHQRKKKRGHGMVNNSVRVVWVTCLRLTIHWH